MTTAFDHVTALRIAKSCARRLHPSHRADAEQALIATALQRWASFDLSRGCSTAFLRVVMERATLSMIRARSALKRGAGLEPLSACETDLLGSREYHSSRAHVPDLRLDVQMVVAGLPPRMRAICDALGAEPATSTARRFGMSRSRLRSVISEIRSRMVRAGLDGVPA